MHDPLAPLLADGVIDEVVARLKSGKEADLWLVRHGAEIVAAKVYKARDTRSFKNDAVYREGRQVRNSRTQRAMNRGSRFGKAASEEDWKVREADALHALHAAGVRVPRPVLYYEGVLLMELVVDAAGQAAPRLVDATLDAAQAAEVYADLRAQTVRMLCTDRIHGDLSPYNVLMGRDGPVIIDFPQVVGAAHNSQAERFYLRDLENLRLHLAGLAPALRARAGDGRQIWRAYLRRELTPEFVPQEQPPGEGEDRSRQDRSRDGRPRGDRPRESRPGDGRPGDGRPRGDRPHDDRPRNDRPPNDRPPNDRPRTDRPRNDRPQGDRSRPHQTGDERPRDGRQHQGRPAAGRTSDVRPPEARGGEARSHQEPPRQPAPHGQGPARGGRQDPGRPDPRERRQHGDRGQRRDARGPAQGPERQRDERRTERPPRRDGPLPEVVRVQRLVPPAGPAPQPGGTPRPPQPPGSPHPHRGQGHGTGQGGVRDPRDLRGRRRR